MDRGADFDTDHRLLVTSLNTPKTKAARRNERKKIVTKKLECDALNKLDVRNTFKEVLETNLRNHSVSEKGPSWEILSEKIVSSLHKTANSVLPVAAKKSRVLEIWRDDTLLNSLLNNRAQCHQSSENYKQYTKQVKKRVRQLKNIKLQKEADAINEHASRKDVEKLFRAMKSDGSAYKKLIGKRSVIQKS